MQNTTRALRQIALCLPQDQRHFVNLIGEERVQGLGDQQPKLFIDGQPRIAYLRFEVGHGIFPQADPITVPNR